MNALEISGEPKYAKQIYKKKSKKKNKTNSEAINDDPHRNLSRFGGFAL